MWQYDIGGGATAIPSLFLSSSFSPIPAVVFASFPAAGTYGLVAQWVERRNNHAEEMVQFRSRPVCTRTFRVFIFLLTPRKDGERSKGHGADCGKTLYRRLTVPNYAPEKGKGRPVCSTGSVGGCNDPQQAGNRLYMPPCGCTRRRRHKQRSEDVASGKDVLSLYGAGRGGGQGRTRIRAYHKQTVTAGRSRSTTAAVITTKCALC